MNDLIKKIKHLNNNENYKKSAAIASHVLKIDADQCDALFAIGMYAWKISINEVAAYHLERASNCAGSSLKMNEALCNFFRETGRFISLNNRANQILNLFPELNHIVEMKVLACAYLGSAFFNTFSWNEALKYYEQAALYADPSKISLPRSIAENIQKGLMASANCLGLLGERLESANRSLLMQYGNVVVCGLFSGMILPDSGHGVAPHHRIGSYELELSEILINAISRKCYKNVVNIGSSWGYYTVGIARMLPKSITTAYEIDADTLRVARQTALANGVEDRIRFMEECNPTTIHKGFHSDYGSLVIIDCEGYEMTLLDMKIAPELERCDILVECHDFVDDSITPTLIERFTNTHDIVRIEKQLKMPFGFEALNRLPVLDRWFSVVEARAEKTWWLWMQTRHDSHGF